MFQKLNYVLLKEYDINISIAGKQMPTILQNCESKFDQILKVKEHYSHNHGTVSTQKQFLLTLNDSILQHSKKKIHTLKQFQMKENLSSFKYIITHTS